MNEKQNSFLGNHRGMRNGQNFNDFSNSPGISEGSNPSSANLERSSMAAN